MIDSHTHLSDERFNSDRDDVILKSIDCGIKKFLEVLTTPEEWQKWTLFEKYNEFYFAFGIHPHNADQYQEKDIIKLINYLSFKNCVAVGETGIDLWYHPEKLSKQLILLETIIEIAYKNSKPLIFHIRNPKQNVSAYKIVYEFINTRKKMITKRGIIHSFSGMPEEAKKFIELGFFIGINATVTYPKNNNLLDTLKKISIEDILTETDSPYLPPQTMRGMRNDPRSINYIIKTISEIKNIKINLVEDTIDLNFSRFLNQSL